MNMLPICKICWTQGHEDDTLAAQCVGRECHEGERSRAIWRIQNELLALRKANQPEGDFKPVPAPPDEPMTIAMMIAKLSAVSNVNWGTIRNDLQALVREQARTDAELCSDLEEKAVAEQKCSTAGDYHTCARAIREAAGLE